MLDNCEHLLDAAADLVETILAAHDDDHVLATSREGLRVDGEQVWPVPSLGTDEGTARPRWSSSSNVPARSTPRSSCGDPAATEAVIEICRRLDGIALGDRARSGTDGVDEARRTYGTA